MDHRTETRNARSPLTAWLRNEHAGARYDEPYPSGEPVPAGAECQLCDEPATVAVPFDDDDGMNMVRCTAYICDEHARRLDADEPMFDGARR